MRPPTSDGHNFFFRTPFLVLLDSMESPLSPDSIHVLVEGSGFWSWPSRASHPRQVGLASWVGLATHVRPPTSDGHNFFIQTSFWVFLDSMEIPFSQNSNHVPVKGNG